MRDGDAVWLRGMPQVRSEDWRSGERGGVVATGAAFAHPGDPVDGDWRAVSGPGGGFAGVWEWGAFRASSPRAPGWPFPCTSLHCERNSGDSGRGRAVRRNGADAETAVGADGSDHSGSAGLVSSTAGNGAGSVHAVGAAGRRAGRGVQVFQWGRQYLVTSPERKWSGCARRTAESGCPYIVRNMSKNDL